MNLKIKNSTATSADMFLYGDIVDDGWDWLDSDITPTDIKEQLDGLKGKELHIYINSGGGDVFAGTAIHNMIKRHDGKTIGHVDGVAASIASVILMACDEIEVPANAYVMIHRPMGGTFGNTDDHLQMCEVLEKIEDSIISTYQLHTDLSKDALSEMMAAETWFTGDQFAECFSKGVTLLDPVQAVACATDQQHKKWPRAIQEPDNNKDDVKDNTDIDKLKLEIELALL